MKDNDGIPHGIRVPVFFDPADWRKISLKAEEKGMTRSQFLIDCVVIAQEALRLRALEKQR